MKRTCKELKRRSRKALLGNYGGAMLAMIVVSLIEGIVMSPFEKQINAYSNATALGVSQSASVTFTTNTFPVFAFLGIFIVALISTVLQAGINAYHLKLARGEEKPVVSIVFGQFKHRPDRFIVATLLLTLIALACMVPAIAIFCLCAVAPLNSSILILPGILLLIIGYIVAIWLSIRFSMMIFILADHPEASAIESMKGSYRMMKGNCGRSLYIAFSFIPMLILVLLSFGIAHLWVSPYISNVNAMFYLDVSGELDFKEEEARRMDEEMGPVLNDEEFL